MLTYLYDAKYRVQDDKKDGELDEGADIDLADYPLPDAINQMHRYRDAIYYAMNEDERPRGKEIIGGYILFPGRSEGDAVENRYFYKSIKQVNIGAFPLLPAYEEDKDKIVLCDLLELHLKEILLDDSVYEHIKDSIPQKGLYYNEGEPLYFMISVSGEENSGYSTQLRNGMPCWIKCKNTKFEGIDILRIRYIVPVIDKCCKGYYEIKSSKTIVDNSRNENFIEFEVFNFKKLGYKAIQLNTFERGISFLASEIKAIFETGNSIQL